MIRVFLALFLVLQGVPTQQGGKVTGVLRDNSGIPLPGIRMAAVARGAAVDEVAANGTSMAGLAETDEHGRYTLEDIPPGRYSIAAGRLDLQTYFPGTQSLTDARILTVVAGETLADINFALNDTSIGRATNTLGGLAPIQARIPIRVTVEGGGKVPLTVGRKTVTLRLESASQSMQPIPIDSASVAVTGPVATDFRVVVENLPEPYEVKSISYGERVIPHGIFNLTAANFPTPAPVPAAAGGLAVALIQSLSTVNNAVQYFISGTPLKPAQTPPSTLSITLSEVQRPSAGGVRISGRAGKDGRRVYISGNPGIVFTDGTFDFRDVPPGRHLIASTGSSGPLANVVVVGNQDFAGIDLKEINILPADARDPKDPMPAGDLPPGTIVPFALVKGIVLEELSKAPIRDGEVIIQSGDVSRTVPLDEKGRFETFSLLPGTYEFKLQIFGHSTSAQSVVIEDKDIDLELATKRLF